MGWAKTIGVVLSTAATGALVVGCEKPPPAITVWSGTNSVYAPALCWAFEASLQRGECAEEIVQGRATDGVPTLAIQPGQTLGISVDPAVAEAGWQVRADGQPLTAQTLDTTYYRVVADNTPDQALTLQVVAGREAQVRGVFLVRLEPEAAA
jgi:hypothetical protein